MQTLRFDSPITGLSPFKDRIAIGTETDGVYVVNISNCTIEIQLSILATSGALEAPVWSRDGDFIWVNSGNQLYFAKPVNDARFQTISFPEHLAAIYPHSDGFSIIAQSESGKLYAVRPVEDQEFTPFFSVEEPDRISSMSYYEKKLSVAIDGPSPRIVTIDGSQNSSVDLPHRESSITSCLSSDFGVILIWADGFWLKPASQHFGSIPPAPSYSFLGSHLCAACEDSLRIFDLKFDAELQRIPVKASICSLFDKKIVSATETRLDICQWHGVTSTTSRSLIGTASSNEETKEFNIEFAFDPSISQPVASDVIVSPASFKIKSLRQVVESVMEEKFVPIEAKESAIQMLEKEEHSDVRDLALFHLLPTIRFEMIEAAFARRSFDTVLILLKKMEALDSEKIVKMLRLCFTVLDENEVILAHFLTQPHGEREINGAVKLLCIDEADLLLEFMTKLLVSRRQWKDFEASMSTFKALINWSSIVISFHAANLTLEGKTEGLQSLQRELKDEIERINSAGQCWSIIENIAEKAKTPHPPTFMYLIEKIQIPE